MVLSGTLDYSGQTYQLKLDDTHTQAHGDACSHVWVCTACGLTYARLRLCDLAGRTRFYIPLSGRCESCPPGFGFVPGSIYSSWDRDFNNAIPLPVMQREVILHCNWFERKDNE